MKNNVNFLCEKHGNRSAFQVLRVSDSEDVEYAFCGMCLAEKLEGIGVKNIAKTEVERNENKRQLDNTITC